MFGIYFAPEPVRLTGKIPRLSSCDPALPSRRRLPQTPSAQGCNYTGVGDGSQAPFFGLLQPAHQCRFRTPHLQAPPSCQTNLTQVEDENAALKVLAQHGAARPVLRSALYRVPPEASRDFLEDGGNVRRTAGTMRREPNGGNRNGGNQVAGMPERGASRRQTRRSNRPFAGRASAPAIVPAVASHVPASSFPPLPHTFPPHRSRLCLRFPPHRSRRLLTFPPFAPPFPLDIPRPGRQSLYGRLRGCFISRRSLAGKASLGCAFRSPVALHSALHLGRRGPGVRSPALQGPVAYLAGPALLQAQGNLTGRRLRRPRLRRLRRRRP